VAFAVGFACGVVAALLLLLCFAGELVSDLLALLWRVIRFAACSAVVCGLFVVLGFAFLSQV
jgi:hypothetical protein